MVVSSEGSEGSTDTVGATCTWHRPWGKTWVWGAGAPRARLPSYVPLWWW